MESFVNMLASQLPGVSQARRLLRLHTPLGPDVLLPEHVHGFEAVSEGAAFRFSLTALSTDSFIDLDDLIGQPVLLELMTAESRVDLRPWHGHVTAFERIGSNQGAARYRLLIEPWLAFLDYRTDSYIFQDATVMDIVESVFDDYIGQGTLAPAWRWELADRSVYPRRSLTTQFQETDLSFVQRLLTSQGLFYWFEHAGDANAESLGQHTLVIADHNEAFAPGTAVPIRFHRADATERSDTIQQWQIKQARHTPQIHLSSWDYRQSALSVASAGRRSDTPVALDAFDTPGLYSYPTRAYGQRLADIQYEAWVALQTAYHGEGVVRYQAPGLRFSLVDHPVGGYEALCLRVHHRMKNNLSAEVYAEAERQLGGVENEPPRLSAALNDTSWGQAETAPESLESAAAHAHNPWDEDFYHNTFYAIPADVTYRAAQKDGHGHWLHPKPSAPASQTAIVVGAAGAPVYTDRDHRIKVQFHWQRGQKAHAQQSHPSDVDNAPADDAAGTWVRVATAQAGANWGSHYLPRVGQEVIVSFVEGDIDRPIVTGTVYNGQGAEDAQHNQVNGSVGSVTGNAAAWFAGKAGAHAHAAVLSGIKTQSLSTSAQGTGGYNQLVFDDTPGQLRTQLSTTQYATGLALGHLKHQNDNAREADRGHGAELATQATGAVRAGQGLLLTTERGPMQLSADGAVAGLSQAHQLTKALSEAADQQQAIVDGDDKTADRAAINALDKSHESAQSTASGTGRDGSADSGDIKSVQGGAGDVPAWSRPDLIVSATAGIAAVTPKDHIANAGHTLSLAAADINQLTQNDYVTAVAHGLRLYTQGQQPSGNKPNQETGIHLHAATGAVSAQAQSGKATLAADQNVTLASTEADMAVSSPKQILLSAGGGGLTIQGGNITLTAPGAVTFHGSQKILTTPAGATAGASSFNTSELAVTKYARERHVCELKSRSAAAAGDATVPLK